MEQTPVQIPDSEMLEAQGRDLKRLNGLIETLRGKLQTEERCRLNAERVVSLIAHSTIGDYDWCKSVCFDYLNR